MLSKSGNYKNGKKEGLWMSFYNDGKMLDSMTFLNGNKTGICLAWHQNMYPSDSMSFKPDGSGVHVSWFDNGNPSTAGFYEKDYIMNGKWQYWHKSGGVSSIETYSHGVLTHKQYFDEKGNKMTDTANCDRPAVYMGKSGKSSWQLYLKNNVYYPQGVRITNSDQAVVVVEGVIDEEGKVAAAELSTSFFPQFDKIAIGVVKKSPDWIPALHHTRKVKYYFRQPIIFSNGQ